MKNAIYLLQAPQVSNKLIADQIAAKLNAKLCYVPMERPDGTSGATPLEGMYTTTYEEELEINDFPQSCRWKVTSREAIGNITDYSEAEVQIRGVYYPPGKVKPTQNMTKPVNHVFRNLARARNENFTFSSPVTLSVQSKWPRERSLG